MSEHCDLDHRVNWFDFIRYWFFVSLVFDLFFAIAIWWIVGTEQLAWGFCQFAWVDACDVVFEEKRKRKPLSP